MSFNDGYTYQERLGRAAVGHTVLSYLTDRWRHSTGEVWMERVEDGQVLLDGRRATGQERLRAGQLLEWHRPPWEEETVPLHYDLIHQDEAIVAVSKPSGLPTMHGGGFLKNTLLTLVLASHPDVVPLHRLGRGTSGLVLFARRGYAAQVLSKDWREHAVHKRYRALASGLAARDHYEITAPIGPVPHARLHSVFAASETGKPSRSTARVLERRSDTTLFEVDIHTGRPHQIRIHLACIGHPLAGDPLYQPGGRPPATLPALPGDGGYFLHAEQLTFTHPLTGAPTCLSAPAPRELSRQEQH